MADSLSDEELEELVRPGRGRRWSRRRWITWVAGAVVAYLGLASFLLWSASSDVLAGRDALISLASVDPLSADLDQLELQLVEAGRPVASGSSKLRSPLLWPLRPVPVVGRQVAVARAIATVADDVVAQTTAVVGEAAELQRAPETERVAVLRRLETGLATLNETLADPDLGPRNNLFGVLATARGDAEVQLGDLRDQARDAEIVVTGLRSFLERSSYLTMAANINEMQVGAGTPLSIGTMELENGDFTVESFVTLEDVDVPSGLPSVDADVATLWGFLAPTNDFKKLMLSPRFDAFGGPQSLVLYEAVADRSLGGSLVLDPVALKAMLTVVGPVEVEGETFDADNVLRYIFVDQYDEFLTGDEVDLSNLSTLSEGQLARRDRLAGIAAATVDALANGEFDPLALIEAFRPVARGRHVLAYSSVPEEQAMWEALGVAGVMDGNEVGVSLLNIGVNKLDPFVDVDVEVTEGPGATSGTRSIELAVTISNDAPPTLPTGVTGYYWETIGMPTPASYLGRLMILAPSGTTSLMLDDPDRQIEVFGKDGPLAVLVTRLEPIPEGTSVTIRAHIELEAGAMTAYELFPSGRYIPVDYTWNGASFNDAVFADIPLDD